MQNHLFFVYTLKYSKIYHVVHLLKHSQVFREHFLSFKDNDLKHASHWDNLELRHWTLCSPNMALEFRHSQRIQITAWAGTVWITQRKYLRWFCLDITLRTERNDPKINTSFAGTTTEGLGLVVKELYVSKRNSNMNITYSKTLQHLRSSEESG